MTHDQAVAAIGNLTDAFPNLTLTPGNVAYWANAITDYPAETAAPAIAALAASEQRVSLAQLREALQTETHRQSNRHGRTNHDELRRIDAMLNRPNLDPEARDTLQHERADLQRDIHEAAAELQRHRDAANPDQPTRHLTGR